MSSDPRYPKPWTERTPLAVLGEVEGFNPYDTGRHIANWRLTPGSVSDRRRRQNFPHPCLRHGEAR